MRSPGRPASAVVEILAGFAKVAKRRGLRWYLFGAQAAILYGVVRTSADVDLTAEVPARELSAFLRDMGRAGFSLRVADDDEFIGTTRVLPFQHRGTGWPVDVVLAGPGLEEAFLDAARVHRIAGVRVPV